MDQPTRVMRALAMTRAIDRAARLADWAEAERLVDARAPYLIALDTEPTPDTLATLHEIQALDAATIAHAERARAELQHAYRFAMERLDSVSQYQLAAARL